MEELELELRGKITQDMKLAMTVCSMSRATVDDSMNFCCLLRHRRDKSFFELFFRIIFDKIIIKPLLYFGAL